MNVLNRMMSYDKTKNENQEKCNCAECLGNAEISEKREIAWDFKYADDFLIKVENYRMMCREYEILNIMNTEYWYKDVKTKNFIWKSLHVHGYKYIYHKSVYVKSKEKLLIECRNGHCFPKTPNDHLNGIGCSHCSGKRKLTTETFIEEANKIHGLGRYDYSKVKYVNNYTEVIIICKKHGNFKMKPNEHLQGHGCKICGNIKCHEKLKLTLEEFIEQANEVHGIRRYDYSKVKYINNKTEVIIICPNHNIPHEFPQTPNNHLNGEGCPLCRSRASKGENDIRNWLIENNIEFKQQKRFDDCRNINTLPFDFYIPKYNLCIEFDGEQHFIPKAFKSKATYDEKLENLKLIQFRDNIKTNYCKNNDIDFLRIKYTENVEEKLTEYFQNHGIIKELTLFDL